MRVLKKVMVFSKSASYQIVHIPKIARMISKKRGLGLGESHVVHTYISLFCFMILEI